MDIEHATGESVHERRGQDAHEAGENDQLRIVCRDFIRQRGVETVAIRETRVVDDSGRNAGRGRALQAMYAGSVADHGADHEGAAGRRRVDQCLQVAAVAGNQHDHRQFTRIAGHR